MITHAHCDVRRMRRYPRLLRAIKIGNIIIDQSHQTSEIPTNLFAATRSKEILCDNRRALAVKEIQIFVEDFHEQVHLG